MARLKTSLGKQLVEAGMITIAQLKEAEEQEKKSGQRLKNILVQMGMVEESDLLNFMSQEFGLPVIDPNNYDINPALFELIPSTLAKKHGVIPIVKFGNRLVCTLFDPSNIIAIDELRMQTRLNIEPVPALEEHIKKCIAGHYKTEAPAPTETTDAQGKEKQAEEKGDEVSQPHVIKLVNLMIKKAIRDRASDIHLEPEENWLTVRFRIDGVLHEQVASPKQLQSAIISRIKILADLDIAEKRVPQDGRFHLAIEGKKIDVRVSTVPTLHGENVVLRLLDASSTLIGLKESGFPDNVLEKYEKLITQPHGIILVAGPTGSGKTTTLYASLDKINSVEKNIITIEDPVEYQLPGIRQIQVNPKVDLTFANGLRSILRQDPDIIMVGEIRDKDTAEIAIQAALTGHLVLSTIHTNDAPSSITRLIDMGIEPYLVSSALIGCLSQRLVRVVCPQCKSKGCANCAKTGYKGRIGIFELLIVNEKIQQLILATASVNEIREAASKIGMISLKEDGLVKVKQGLTTEAEVIRVTQHD